jgi:hypothetical protein
LRNIDQVSKYCEWCDSAKLGIPLITFANGFAVKDGLAAFCLLVRAGPCSPNVSEMKRNQSGVEHGEELHGFKSKEKFSGFLPSTSARRDDVVLSKYDIGIVSSSLSCDSRSVLIFSRSAIIFSVYFGSSMAI